MISKLISKLAEASGFDNVARLLFGTGFALGITLCLGYQTIRAIPVAVAFGLLCFGCGIVLTQFLELRRCAKASMDSCHMWTNSLFELSEERSKLEEDRTAWEEEKERWLEQWDASIKKEVLALLEREATRRGGEQIERNMNPG